MKIAASQAADGRLRLGHALAKARRDADGFKGFRLPGQFGFHWPKRLPAALGNADQLFVLFGAKDQCVRQQIVAATMEDIPLAEIKPESVAQVIDLGRIQRPGQRSHRVG